MPIRLLAGSKVAPLKQGFSGHGDRTRGANGKTSQGTTTGYYPGPLDPKWLDSAIQLGLHMYQFQKMLLLMKNYATFVCKAINILFQFLNFKILILNETLAFLCCSSSLIFQQAEGKLLLVQQNCPVVSCVQKKCKCEFENMIKKLRKSEISNN